MTVKTLKMNRLQGLVATYWDDASSDNEFTVAGKKARQMIMDATGCQLWASSCVVSFLGKNEVWFPHPSKEGCYGERPSDALVVFKGLLVKLGIRYSETDYGFGGTTLKKLN